MIGRIHKIAANDCEVHVEGGVLRCRFRGKLKREWKVALKLAAVGDLVEVTPGAAGEGTIEKVLPCRSKFSRHDVLRPSREQVIVANVDLLFIVQAAQDPDFNDLIVDKCTVMGAANGLPCVIVVNKSDLARPDLSVYEKTGYRCVRTSAKTGEGVSEICGFLKDRTTVFLGPSGVGKSSLINLLAPGADVNVGEVSRHGEGRHTTSWVELLSAGGGLVADTPGMEFFTLWNVTSENLKDHFLDFVELAAGCRFRDCLHTDEEVCAVRGHVAGSRYRNYRAILERFRSGRSRKRGPMGRSI